MTDPFIYFLHGDDPAGISERLKILSASLGEPGMADLNLARLDGRICDENDIRNAALAIPFLADHRLIIVHNPLVKLSFDNQKQRFLALLGEIPSTTQLVLVINDESAWRKNAQGRWEKNWKTLNPSHWLMKWEKEHPGQVSVEGFHLPDQKEMPGWITEEAKKQGGQFSPQAASALAEYTGSETQIARLEIEKLLFYVDFKRTVTDEDVYAVSISQNQANVFQFSDAVASGQKSQGLHLLNQLVETDDPLMIFGNLVSHFRRLVLIKEALQQGGNTESISKDFGLFGKNADKILQQCRRFSLDELKKAFLRLAELDFEIKNGITPADLALETFLMELKPVKTL
jgi:DNA polymerase III subunit delta